MCLPKITNSLRAYSVLSITEYGASPRCAAHLHFLKFAFCFPFEITAVCFLLQKSAQREAEKVYVFEGT